MPIAILDGPERPSAELPPFWEILMPTQLPAQLLPEDDPVGAGVGPGTVPPGTTVGGIRGTAAVFVAEEQYASKKEVAETISFVSEH